MPPAARPATPDFSLLSDVELRNYANYGYVPPRALFADPANWLSPTFGGRTQDPGHVGGTGIIGAVNDRNYHAVALERGWEPCYCETTPCPACLDTGFLVAPNYGTIPPDVRAEPDFTCLACDDVTRTECQVCLGTGLNHTTPVLHRIHRGCSGRGYQLCYCTVSHDTADPNCEHCNGDGMHKCEGCYGRGTVPDLPPRPTHADPKTMALTNELIALAARQAQLAGHTAPAVLDDDALSPTTAPAYGNRVVYLESKERRDCRACFDGTELVTHRDGSRSITTCRACKGKGSLPVARGNWLCNVDLNSAYAEHSETGEIRTDIPPSWTEDVWHAKNDRGQQRVTLTRPGGWVLRYGIHWPKHLPTTTGKRDQHVKKTPSRIALSQPATHSHESLRCGPCGASLVARASEPTRWFCPRCG